MARKPSERTHRQKPPEDLDLTSFMDMITCLMFFLLLFAGMLPVVIIDAPLPKVASTADEVRQAKEQKEDLDLTVWINSNGFVVKSSKTGARTINKKGEDYDYDELHRFLVRVKSMRADERDLTLVPADDVEYKVMIQTMDVARELRTGDEGFRQLPPEIVQKPESLKFNRLFPDVTIGGV